MEQKPCESNNEDLLSGSGITSNAGSSSPFFVSSIRGTVIENTSSTGTLTQIPFFPKYEVELDSHRKAIPYPGKEHIERVLEEYSHQVKDLQRRLNEPLLLPVPCVYPPFQQCQATCSSLDVLHCPRPSCLCPGSFLFSTCLPGNLRSIKTQLKHFLL